MWSINNLSATIVVVVVNSLLSNSTESPFSAHTHTRTRSCRSLLCDMALTVKLVKAYEGYVVRSAIVRCGMQHVDWSILQPPRFASFFVGDAALLFSFDMELIL